MENAINTSTFDRDAYWRLVQKVMDGMRGKKWHFVGEWIRTFEKRSSSQPHEVCPIVVRTNCFNCDVEFALKERFGVENRQFAWMIASAADSDMRTFIVKATQSDNIDADQVDYLFKTTRALLLNAMSSSNMIFNEVSA